LEGGALSGRPERAFYWGNLEGRGKKLKKKHTPWKGAGGGGRIRGKEEGKQNLQFIGLDRSTWLRKDGLK
jgi:hypothetical protein